MCGPFGHLRLGPKLTKLKVRFALVRTEADREVAAVLTGSTIRMPAINDPFVCLFFSFTRAIPCSLFYDTIYNTIIHISAGAFTCSIHYNIKIVIKKNKK